MKVSLILRIVALLMLLPEVSSLPLPIPESILEGGPEIQFLWNSAQTGTLFSVLPVVYKGPVRDQWESFLREAGAEIIDTYYK